MTRDSKLNNIKSTVAAILPDARVWLFGSRAKGNHDAYSDYDLLVITPNQLTRAERLKWTNQLNWAIVKAIHAPIDILLFSEAEISEKQELPGHIVRSAIKEGVAL